MEELKTFSDRFEEDVYEAVSLRACVNRRLTAGAPGLSAMDEEIALSRTWLEAQK
jgi:argininosuccinate lyase